LFLILLSSTVFDHQVLASKFTSFLLEAMETSLLSFGSPATQVLKWLRAKWPGCVDSDSGRKLIVTE